MQDAFEQFKEALVSMSPMQIALFVVFFLAVWFIPTFLGLIRNRKHIGKIFLLNIPAGFTVTSWFILMGVVLIKFDDFEELKSRVLRRNKSENNVDPVSN